MQSNAHHVKKWLCNVLREALPRRSLVPQNYIQNIDPR
jgi:hypothetical protein